MTEDTSSSRGRVLVVEDWRIIARDLASTLGELGYQVLGIAGNGLEAIAKARGLHPDIVLMDVRLPGDVDGVEAATTIKRELDIPVIYMTAHSDDETLRRAKLSEPLAFLVKPFRPPELKCAIEVSLQNHAIDRRLRARLDELERRGAELEAEAERARRDLDVVAALVRGESAEVLACCDALERGDAAAGVERLRGAARRLAERVAEIAGPLRSSLAPGPSDEPARGD